MNLDRKIRLAAYVSTAFGGAAAHADIHVYHGPAIPIGVGSIMLDLEGLQMELGFTGRTFSESGRVTWWTCCTSNGDPSCRWSDIAVQNDLNGNKVFSAFGVEGISTVDFLPLGQAPQGSQTGLDSTQACFFTSMNIVRCGEVSSVAVERFGDQRTLYLGFTAPREGSTLTGWIEIDRSTGGSYSITRWAYEDDGSLILTGQVAEEPCAGDIDDDGEVDSADLGALLAGWGKLQQEGRVPRGHRRKRRGRRCGPRPAGRGLGTVSRPTLHRRGLLQRRPLHPVRLHRRHLLHRRSPDRRMRSRGLLHRERDSGLRG